MCVKLESAPGCPSASVRIPHSGNLAKTIFRNAEPWEEVNLLRWSVGSQATKKYLLRARCVGSLARIERWLWVICVSLWEVAPDSVEGSGWGNSYRNAESRESGEGGFVLPRGWGMGENRKACVPVRKVMPGQAGLQALSTAGWWMGSPRCGRVTSVLHWVLHLPPDRNPKARAEAEGPCRLLFQCHGGRSPTALAGEVHSGPCENPPSDLCAFTEWCCNSLFFSSQRQGETCRRGESKCGKRK